MNINLNSVAWHRFKIYLQKFIIFQFPKMKTLKTEGTFKNKLEEKGKHFSRLGT